jgi:hypothetical protein
VQSVSFSRGALALIVVVAMLGGAIAGSLATELGSDGPTMTPALPASPPPSSAALPAADAPGEDLARLPRYPGSVRSAYEVVRDDVYRLKAAEYLALASVDDVRAFYQGVIAEHGWQRADIGFSHGEWAYVLVDGSVEALIEIEEFGDLVEIDLQLSEPLRRPARTPAPTPTAPPQQPPPPPPPPPDDDDGDDDGDDGTDDAGESDD